ncbi:nicotinate phosphoribosyltransferase [Methanomassiliicoccus luminyensis]|uniref:nicotinate phosphoribosyltransferase n=1 Tax=Methanomassiliicoccus luminyensis TaxID=1080712 RepID=UPI00037CA9D9|nr:nicotinate phosphoribosyltransferase [Methanomassiliicoccus luminyensis]
MKRFFTATDEDIVQGRTTDIYFIRTMEVLKAKDMLGAEALAEMTLAKFPRDWKWGVFCGLEEALRLLEGKNVDIWGLPEGTVFPCRTQSGIKLPVLNIEGPYSEYCVMETPMLGFMCHSTGVATMAARCRKAAKDRPMMAFGVRRTHPAISPMLDRSSYIGGCDGVSSLMGAELIGKEPDGTMPHALIVMLGSSQEAFRAFDEFTEPSVPRIALVDTYSDEKADAILAAETIRDLAGVRLDTPGSRRGSFPDLVREVRWELDLRGYHKVKILLSGGLDDKTLPELVEAGADGFGVGTSISSAPTVDFALDIVEKDGAPVAKRGKFGGRKFLFKCPDCFNYEVSADQDEVPVCRCCGKEMRTASVKLMEGGKRTSKGKEPKDIRSDVLRQLEQLELN